MNFKTVKGILRSPRLGLFSSMHDKNRGFKNKKTTQIFDRYATYNGSNPYQAPALLNQITHLEFGKGAYLPENGMHDITTYLHRMAVFAGVNFRLNEKVEQICLKDDQITGLVSNGKMHASTRIVCNADLHFVYKHLLPGEYSPPKTLAQEKSSSAYVFYWGIKKNFGNSDYITFYSAKITKRSSKPFLQNKLHITILLSTLISPVNFAALMHPAAARIGL